MAKLIPTRKKMIRKNDLAHERHVCFLEKVEDMSMDAFDFVMDKAVQAILKKLREPKVAALKKADELKRGWTGAIPRADLELPNIMEELLEQYTEALKWILLGDLAGRDARIAAKLMKLDEFVVPGIVPAAYLDSLDTHRQHYEDLFGEEPPEINRNLVKESMGQIKTRTERFMDEASIKLKNRMIESVEAEIKRMHEETVAAIHESAHRLMGEGANRQAALNEAVENETPDKIPVPQISRALKEAIERYRPDWNLMTRTDTNLASAVGAHQSLTEVFGRGDDSPKIAWFAFRDEKTCSFCDEASRRADGSFKIYHLNDFAPAGANLSRKKKEWVLSIPPAHYNCRCQLIYIPVGFDIDQNGNLRPSSKPSL